MTEWYGLGHRAGHRGIVVPLSGLSNSLERPDFYLFYFYYFYFYFNLFGRDWSRNKMVTSPDNNPATLLCTSATVIAWDSAHTVPITPRSINRPQDVKNTICYKMKYVNSTVFYVGLFFYLPHSKNANVSGEFPAQRPVTLGFFFDLRLNKRLSKQWWGWWFETLSRPLWLSL